MRTRGDGKASSHRRDKSGPYAKVLLCFVVTLKVGGKFFIEKVVVKSDASFDVPDFVTVFK